MKRKIPWLIVGIMALLVGLVGAGCAAGAAGQTGANSLSIPDLGGVLQPNGIHVSGEGKVVATPDLIVASLGIESQALTVAEAQANARKAMDAVMNALKANGVKDKDIQTQNFSIAPVTRWIDKEGRQEITGYRVSNIVTVKLRQLDVAGTIIDAVADAGGDSARVQGISFTVENPEVLKAQAEKLALQDAKARATAMAETLGVDLGKLIYAQFGYTSLPVPMSLVRDSVAKAGESLPPTVINPGELTITASAQLVYAIQ